MRTRNELFSQRWLSPLGLGQPFFNPLSTKQSRTIAMQFGSAMPLQAGARLFLPTDQQLSNSTITGIECIDNTQLTSYAEEGAGTFDLLTPAQHAYGVLYLVDYKDTVLAEMPLYSLLGSVQLDKVTRFNTKINVRSCYIIWSDVSGFSASNGIVFRFYFNER
jgi:hypothetical protein